MRDVAAQNPRADRVKCSHHRQSSVFASRSRSEPRSDRFGTVGDVQNSLLEVALARIVATDSKSPDSIYAPGRFIAIVDRSPEVALGLEEIELQSSVQVISGRWK